MLTLFPDAAAIRADLAAHPGAATGDVAGCACQGWAAAVRAGNRRLCNQRLRAQRYPRCRKGRAAILADAV